MSKWWPLDSIATTRVALYVILAAVIVFVVLPKLDSLWPGAREDARTIQTAKDWLHAGQTRRAQIDRLVAARNAAVAAARASAAEAAIHHAAAAALAGQLALAKTARDSVPILVSEFHALAAENLNLATAYANALTALHADTVAIVKLTTNLADATRNLQGVVKVADCHMLGLSFLPKCLSRTASAAVGAAAAAVAVVTTGGRL
jgi:hypothetical protein